MVKRKWIYDVEVFPNFFGVTFKSISNDEVKTYIIYNNITDVDELYKFLLEEVGWLIGYNNSKYDNLILNYIINNRFIKNDINILIFNLSCGIIETSNSGESLWVKYKDIYNSKLYKSLDLMKILAFDKKRIGLKKVAINLEWHKIQDLPKKFDSDVEEHEVDSIMLYNLNDVDITKALYYKIMPEIKLRDGIGKDYGVDVMNCSNSAIGDKLLAKYYEDYTGLEYKEFKDLRTKRDSIKLSDCISPMIKFSDYKLKSLLGNIKQTVIFSTNGDFRNEFIYKNKKYTVAQGGIHSNNPSAIFRSDDEYDIITADVTGYYPNLILGLEITPKHLGKDFLYIGKLIVDDRSRAKKIDSKGAKAEALKIVTNSTLFGKMGFEHSFIYDPLAAMSVTINGQLFLLMLIEALEESGIEVIMANTDGIECKVPKSKTELYYKICKEWEEYSKLSLEFDIYKLLVVRDVSSYISLTKSLKIKEKGVFLTYIPGTTDRRSKISLVDDLTRAYDMPIVAEALHQYFINNQPVRDTIMNCKEIYKFCTSQKIGSQYKQVILEYIEGSEKKIKICQKTNRYFISTSGGSLIKIKDNNKRANMVSGQSITLFNDYFESTNYKINYNYYIEETNKIINSIKNNNQVSIFDINGV